MIKSNYNKRASKPISSRVLNSYLLHESNKAFRALRSTLDLQLSNPDPKGKIVQTIKNLSVSQNNDLTPKLDSTRQHKFRDMLDFQNGAPKSKL